MNRYDEFEASVLRVAPAEIVPNRSFSLSTTGEGAKRQIPEPLIREILINMCKRELISLSLYDGRKETSIQEWLSQDRSPDAFFLNTCDAGHVRIRLLLAGAARLEAQKKQPIGFVANA
jgi:hypothetical protein